MADKEVRKQLVVYLKKVPTAQSVGEIRQGLPVLKEIPERTLRRWLDAAVGEGEVIRTGEKRGTRYIGVPTPEIPNFAFLESYTAPERQTIMQSLRGIWTHNSTALEGNTLTLGETEFILSEGLTISGHSVREHQEVVGHASAIELLYRALGSPIDFDTLHAMHKAVQTEVIHDIDKPYGAWKVQSNGTYAYSEGRRVYLAYAQPYEVPHLMTELVSFVNEAAHCQLRASQAAACYAQVHVGFVHIHPYWDGNGRVSRLVANIPLLRSGLPPVVIPKEWRKEYLSLLSEYELTVGEVDRDTGLWPKPEMLASFTEFIERCYTKTRELLSL
ncbi:Fic family protein [Corallincola luteus]|uniref:Fic family protein n=1 Tax=Corallincola luteus TaxID=1775177 RepID=A0ABY2ART8_9GAMM|nr:Fic family protein [Corallincola luteus]TCI05173.1 Fic family protein [Corallincola luteus]